MPPGNKGMKKKGDRKDNSRPPRSRNTTPSAASSASTATQGVTALVGARIQPLTGHSWEDLTEVVPDSNALHGILGRLRALSETVDIKGQEMDAGMRKLAMTRKDLARENEEEKRNEELREQSKLREEQDKVKKASKKKDNGKNKEDRPLTHGAHGVAAQDGSSIGFSGTTSIMRRDSGSSSLSPPAGISTPEPAGANNPTEQAAVIADDDDDDDADSLDEHQPVPKPSMPHLTYFGNDPSTFPDETNYELGYVKPGMSTTEIRKICAVSNFPERDLADLGPGTPPDKDFSNSKPTNQVQATTFQTYLEPYFQPYGDEHLAWLRSRGNRVEPYVIPRRGRHYKEVWAEEDGIDFGGSDSKQNETVYEGNLDDLPVEALESDKIACAPGSMVTRLLQAMRPEFRATAPEPVLDGANGDMNTSMGGMGDNDDLNDILDVGGNNRSNGFGGSNGFGDPMNQNFGGPNSFTNFGGNNSFGSNGNLDDGMSMGMASLPPATQMPGSNTDAWKKLTSPAMDSAQMDEALRIQLVYAGLLEPDDKPDYEGHFDDDIAARLRLLQAWLKDITLINGARKARLSELVQEPLAYQEYYNVHNDLAQQLNAMFAKRSRTLGKKGKNKRPHAATGSIGNSAGQAKPAIGDQTRLLQNRRKNWAGTVGQIFEDPKAFTVPRSKDEGTSIFKPEEMGPYTVAERQRIVDEEAEVDDE